MIEYEPGMPLSLFVEELANTRREADKDLLKRQLGHVAKGNSFYGKMIEGKGRHKSKKFTREEWVVDKALRSPFFDNLEEAGGAYEIKERKRTVMIKRPYQCGIAVYQLTKLRMLEFHYDFLDKYFSRQDKDLLDIDKAKNVGFRVYDQGVVTYKQKKLDYLPITISFMSWLMVFIQCRWIFKSTIKDVFHTRLLGVSNNFS